MEAKGNPEQAAEVSNQQTGATGFEPAVAEIYRTADEVEEVVRKFETCAFAPEEFDHPAHLLVALCYLLKLSEAEALARMRANLLSFLAHYELPRVYNETITRFWIRRVRSLLGSLDSPAQEHELAALANEIIARGGAPQLVFEYFSRARLAAEETAYEWVEPDLRPLDF